MNVEEEKFRLPIPTSIFDLCTVPYGDVPRTAIRIDCEFTANEEKLYDMNSRVQHIPCGLANECTHSLVFATRGQKDEFINKFSNESAMGHFACGSTEAEIRVAMKAMNQGKPLFVLEGTGPVATIIKAFIEKDELKTSKFMSSSEIMVDTETEPFMNEAAVDEALMLSNTQNDMINHYNPDAYYVSMELKNIISPTNNLLRVLLQITVIGLDNASNHGMISKQEKSCIQDIKDRITEVMATAFDFNHEIGGEEEDMRAIDLCETLADQIASAKNRYQRWGTALHLLIQAILVSVI